MAIRFKYDTGSGIIASFAGGMQNAERRKQKYLMDRSLLQQQHQNRLQQIGLAGGLRAGRLGGGVRGRVEDPLLKDLPDPKAIPPEIANMPTGTPEQRAAAAAARRKWISEARRKWITARAKAQRRGRLGRLGRADEVLAGERLDFIDADTIERRRDAAEAETKIQQEKDYYEWKTGVDTAADISKEKRDAVREREEQAREQQLEQREAYDAGELVLPSTKLQTELEGIRQRRDRQNPQVVNLSDDEYREVQLKDDMRERQILSQATPRPGPQIITDPTTGETFKKQDDWEPFQSQAAAQQKEQQELQREQQQQYREDTSKYATQVGTRAQQLQKDDIASHAMDDETYTPLPYDEYVAKAKAQLTAEGITPPQPPSATPTAGAPSTPATTPATTPGEAPQESPQEEPTTPEERELADATALWEQSKALVAAATQKVADAKGKANLPVSAQAHAEAAEGAKEAAERAAPTVPPPEPQQVQEALPGPFKRAHPEMAKTLEWAASTPPQDMTPEQLEKVAEAMDAARTFRNNMQQHRNKPKPPTEQPTPQGTAFTDILPAELADNITDADKGWINALASGNMQALGAVREAWRRYNKPSPERPAKEPAKPITQRRGNRRTASAQATGGGKQSQKVAAPPSVKESLASASQSAGQAASEIAQGILLKYVGTDEVGNLKWPSAPKRTPDKPVAASIRESGYYRENKDILRRQIKASLPTEVGAAMLNDLASQPKEVWDSFFKSLGALTKKHSVANSEYARRVNR